jgi:hypothetical protein
VGLLNSELFFAMDVDLWIRMMLAGMTIRVVDDFVGGFRLIPNSKTCSQHLRFTEDMQRILTSTSTTADASIRRACQIGLRRAYYNAAQNALALGISRPLLHYAGQDLKVRGIAGCGTMAVALSSLLPRSVRQMFRYLKLGIRNRFRKCSPLLWPKAAWNRR